MKNLPKNVWQKKLNADDWNFSACPSEELAMCITWEVRREKAQLEADGELRHRPDLPELSADERRMARYWSADRCPKAKVRTYLKQISQVPQGWIVAPEFPQLSYLAMRKKQRWCRFPDPDRLLWTWLDFDWHKYFSGNWDELHEIVRTIPQRPLWIGGELQREICPLAIPWAWRDEQIIEAFGEWLKYCRPKGEKWDERPRVEQPAKPENKGETCRRREVFHQTYADSSSSAGVEKPLPD